MIQMRRREGDMEPVKCVCGGVPMVVGCKQVICKAGCGRAGQAWDTPAHAIAAWNSDQLALKMHERLVEALTQSNSVFSGAINEDVVMDCPTTLSHSVHSAIGKQRALNRRILKEVRGEE